jgi:hypothetical protein
MTIEERLDRIEKKLDLLIEQTAPPPSVKSKVQLRAAARELFADSAKRKKTREENRLKKQNAMAEGQGTKTVKAKR